ncbi:hypothetical protein CO058_01235 [candidate division WWE3 bacterium CG_4_9_14_0_2_um_filter_35_11]|uniref:Uncharacterized protein n=1 Tax=candidate division WWE3 bacterium CG_4_9_14_0_2_um_filter_35_11 TaxID=1975077 RepID=A0A2M8EM98_UNCKA|nr:MAG: hypothetical protein COV25_03055 [candidate division WWE3 bacterium CG10_big_fil_rev_8_21_14_0_10_35_32]PJC23864.1 MAG: hypothetical protein CO058_01235 [candidate division WWE3 bacterium CG_4_9_14_0_2_um_filter_35_11]
MKEDQLKKLNKLLGRSVSLKQAFYRGLATGFGGLLGATLLVTVVVWGLSRLEFIPIIGTFVTQITDFVVNNSAIADPRITQ